MIIYDVMYVIMTLCDVVGRLFLGFRKKGAVCIGLFFAVASCTHIHNIIHVYIHVQMLAEIPAYIARLLAPR